jgi:N-acetylneuraminic acid mutarotase
MNLLDLPDEVLLGVASWLPLSGLLSCRLVCRSANRLCSDQSLWKGRFLEAETLQRNPSQGGSPPPSERLWCSSVVLNDKMYVYGGHTTRGTSNLINNVKNDLYEYDLVTRKWTPLEHCMPGKTEHKCVVHKDTLYFIGGYNGYDYTNDMFKYDTVTKTSSPVDYANSASAFTPRSALTAVVWNGKLYTFGGWNGFSKKWFNDLHQFDFETREWKEIVAKGEVPPQRTSHSAVVYNNSMYIFAGFSGENYMNDLYEFNFITQTWTNITEQGIGKRPAPRSRFCAAVYGQHMYLLGGWNKVSYFDDFYSYNFVTKEWTQICNENFSIPGISQYAISVFNNFLYVFGGFCAKTKECINRLYIYNLPEEDIGEDSNNNTIARKRSRSCRDEDKYHASLALQPVTYVASE